MKFPKTLVFYLPRIFVRKASETGEVIDSDIKDLRIVELLSKELGFSYKVYNESRDEDMMLGDFVLRSDFINVAFFPYEISEVSFATIKPNYVSNDLAQTKPFSLNVWIGLLLSILLMTFAHLLVFRGRVPIVTVLFYASATFLAQQPNWRPKSNAQKLLSLTWSVGITFLTLSYGSTVFSFLTLPTREKGITDFNELYEAMVLGRATALEFVNSGMRLALGNSDDERARYISESLWMGRIGSAFELKKVNISNVAVIGTRNRLEMIYGGNTHFISRDSVAQVMNALFDWRWNDTSEKFCCKEKMNRAIHRLWESGLNKKVSNDLVFNHMLPFLSKKAYVHTLEDPVKALSLSSISGAFYFLIAGHILGLICLTCEIITHRLIHKA